MSGALAAIALICSSPGVIDGDTFRCGDVHVRLWGVNAPERHDTGGPEATRALAQIITGQRLDCYPKGHSYNRIVMRCFVGRMDVAGEMVRQGQAVDWPRYSHGFYRRGR